VHVGDKASKRLARGVDDLGKREEGGEGGILMNIYSMALPLWYLS